MYSGKPCGSPDLGIGRIKSLFLLVNTKRRKRWLGNASLYASLFRLQLFLKTTNVLTIDQPTKNCKYMKNCRIGEMHKILCWFKDLMNFYV